MNEKINWRVVLAIALIAWLIAGRPGCNSTDDADPSTPEVKVGLVAIVYEHADMRPPLHVHAPAEQLRSEGYEVRVTDQDVTTGGGTIPAELKSAIPAAKTTGLPALVIVAVDGSVIESVPLPATSEGILNYVYQHSENNSSGTTNTGEGIRLISLSLNAAVMIFALYAIFLNVRATKARESQG